MEYIDDCSKRYMNMELIAKFISMGPAVQISR